MNIKPRRRSNPCQTSKLSGFAAPASFLTLPGTKCVRTMSSCRAAMIEKQRRVRNCEVHPWHSSWPYASHGLGHWPHRCPPLAHHGMDESSLSSPSSAAASSFFSFLDLAGLGLGLGASSPVSVVLAFFGGFGSPPSGVSLFCAAFLGPLLRLPHLAPHLAPHQA